MNNAHICHALISSNLKNMFALYCFYFIELFILVTDALHIYVGFFVDINLFKASKERAAEIAKDKSSIVEDVSSDMPGKYGLADEDANLMIKLKFLTYKVCIHIIKGRYLLIKIY